MANENTSSLSADFVDQIKSGSDQGLPIDTILKRMSQDEINAFVITQYNNLSRQFKDLSDQYQTVIDHAKKNNKEIIDRIEHILSLMTANMVFIKQLVQITDVTTARLGEQEKMNSKQELTFANLVSNQNRFSQCLDNMSKNNVAIVKAMEDLKSKVDAHDKFNAKIAILISIGTLVIGWIMSGTNFSQIMVLINEFLNKAS